MDSEEVLEAVQYSYILSRGAPILFFQRRYNPDTRTEGVGRYKYQSNTRAFFFKLVNTNGKKKMYDKL